MKTPQRSRKARPAKAGSAHSLLQKSTELGLAVPHVVAHRVARMALAGPVMSERDKTEFQRMFAEKQQAFAQSWQAMATQTVRAQQALAMTWTAALMNPLALGPSLIRRNTSAAQALNSGMGILHAGLGPVHRKAVANAKRLQRTRLR